MLIVQVCDFGEDGDAFYRLHSPSRFLARLDGITTVDVHFYHRHLPELLEQADVVVLQFLDDWELLSLCKRRRAAGKITIFEANDYFFDIQPWNPIAQRWHDRELQQLYRYLLRWADGVQTSSHALAAAWKEMGARDVAVFRNHITEVAPLPELEERPFTVGWAGSPGHFADWFSVAPYLSAWLSRNPDTHLAVMTNEVAKPFFSLPPERYTFEQFGSLEAYKRFLCSLDVGLAPLLPTGYNRGRSDVKFLEYATQGVVGIYWDLEPYRESVIDGEDGFLVAGPEEAMKRLDTLRNDVQTRLRMRQQAYAKVTRTRLLTDHIPERVAWYREIQAKAGGEGALRSFGGVSPELAEAAVSDGRYLQLRAQAPERELVAALECRDRGEALRRLQGLTERYPRYQAALHSLAVTANSCRDTDTAMTAVNSLVQGEPGSLKGAIERGRAHFLAGKRENALRDVQAIVVSDPEYLPAWKYLLKLMSICGAPASERPVQVSALFPECYTIEIMLAEIGSIDERIRGVADVLDRLAHSLKVDERDDVRRVCRGSVMSLVRAGASNPALQPALCQLLSHAIALFPESAVLRGAHAALLHAVATQQICSGDPNGSTTLRRAYDAYELLRRLRKESAVEREEFSEPISVADIACLAEYIARYEDG